MAKQSFGNNHGKVRKRAVITLAFDDGWKSVYQNAFPILFRAGLRATHYIISGHLDSAQFPAYMDTNQIQELKSAGHEIGCHSVSHRHLTSEPDALLESEIKCSKTFLVGCGFDVKTFAYPYGEYDERVVDCARRAGFLGARTIDPGFNDYETDSMLLRAHTLTIGTSVAQVAKWIDEAVEGGKWLILVFHQVDREGRKWSVLPETLEGIVREIKKRHLQTLTVAEGLERVLGIERRSLESLN